MGAFGFIDKVADFEQNESLTAYFTLTGKEEFLKDHFKGFPVMPGVLLLETAKQAADALLQKSESRKGENYRLARVEDVRFGQFVKPGSELKVSIRLLKNENNAHIFDGRIDLTKAPFGKVLSATMTLVPV